MEEGDIDIGLNDISSDIVKEGENKSFIGKNKYIIIFFISIFILILLMIFIIILLSKKTSDLKEIGIFKCIYSIDKTSSNVSILGKEYIKNSEIDIFVNGKKITFTKEYKFSKTGNHSIDFVIYEDLSMDYMFKNVSSLISIEIISNNDLKIFSMISSFENCKN